jgi:sugar phosphate permease
MDTKRGEYNYWFLGGACFLAYTACYSGRGILSAMIPQILQETSLTKELLGRMGSAFFFSYGIGQLINGFIGDFVKPKYMVGLGLFLAGLVNCGFPIFQSAMVQTVLWGVCGLCCSMLWGAPIKGYCREYSGKDG